MKLILMIAAIVAITPFTGMGCDVDNEKAYMLLHDTDTFKNAAIGITGETPETILALRCLLKQDRRTELFRQLLEEASHPAGKLYALVGLYLCNRPFFDKVADHAITADTLVPTIFGCLLDQRRAGELIAEIKNGNLPRQFTAKRHPQE